MIKHKNKHQKIYRIKNWAADNEALKQRGSLTVWISGWALAHWQAQTTGEPGAPKTYADPAIEAALTIRKLFRLPRRQGKKIHIGIDADGEIRMGEVTDETTGDSAVAKSLLAQETAVIHSLTTDGAYDKRAVYAAAEQRGIPKLVIPPQKNARIWRYGNRAGPRHPRDENLRAIRQYGRSRWQELSGYHRRSLVETAMFRCKTIFGERALSREDSRLRTELKLAFKLLNRMFELGMPESYAVAA